MLKKTISGDSFEAIAKRFGVTESSLIRHLENHVSKDIPAVTVQKEVVPSDISQVISESLAELEWAKQRAKEKDDIRAFTDTVKTKLAFCMKFVEAQNQPAVENGKIVTVEMYNKLIKLFNEEYGNLHLQHMRILYVLNLVFSLPRGDVYSQFMDLFNRESNLSHDSSFYKTIFEEINEFNHKNPNKDAEAYKEKIAEIARDVEKNNPVYNKYKEKPDSFDVVKLLLISQKQEEHKKILAKKSYTKKDVKRAQQLYDEVEELDPDFKIRGKYSDEPRRPNDS